MFISCDYLFYDLFSISDYIALMIN